MLRSVPLFIFYFSSQAIKEAIWIFPQNSTEKHFCPRKNWSRFRCSSKTTFLWWKQEGYKLCENPVVATQTQERKHRVYVFCLRMESGFGRRRHRKREKSSSYSSSLPPAISKVAPLSANHNRAGQSCQTFKIEYKNFDGSGAHFQKIRWNFF